MEQSAIFLPQESEEAPTFSETAPDWITRIMKTMSILLCLKLLFASEKVPFLNSSLLVWSVNSLALCSLAVIPGISLIRSPVAAFSLSVSCSSPSFYHRFRPDDKSVQTLFQQLDWPILPSGIKPEQSQPSSLIINYYCWLLFIITNKLSSILLWSLLSIIWYWSLVLITVS